MATGLFVRRRQTLGGMMEDGTLTDVRTLRYRRHYFMASGPNSEAAKTEFKEHADQESAHADQLADRIVQLGGEADFSPSTLTLRSHAEYVEGDTVEDMIKENLVAERIAIDSYRDMIRYLGCIGESTPLFRQ